MNHEFFDGLIQTVNASKNFTVLIYLVLAIFSGLAAKYFIKQFHRYAGKSKNLYDDLFFRTRLDQSLVNVVAVSVLYSGVSSMENEIKLLTKALEIALVYLFLRFFIRLVAFLNMAYETKPISKKRPLKGIGQLANILFSIIAFVLFISLLLDESPLVLLSGLGALSAVLLLVFRDTIVNFVSGIQVTMNNLIEVGDWITVPNYDTDGEVIEISLYFVKVCNFDNTISMIQMSQLVNTAIFNWRGMYEKKARRIKRAVNFSVDSVKFADAGLWEKLGETRLLEKFLEKENIGSSVNNEENRDLGEEGSSVTNLELFRKYATFYLRSLPTINQELLIMVRQMSMTSTGVPVEVYAFANTIQWAEYEQIQAEIFEHLFAISRFFDLEIFQNPSGESLNRALALQKTL